MYSVLRFVAEKEELVSELEGIGGILNESVPGAFRGLDRIGGRFSVSISNNADWHQHECEIGDFIDLSKGAIAEAHRVGISIEVDIAVETSDSMGVPYLTLWLSQPILQRLATNGIMIGFTFYST